MAIDTAKVQELLEGASRLTGAAREEFLVARCGDDQETRREVESLLTALDLSRDPIEVSPLRFAVPPGEKPGDRIGRYELVEVIGEGGFGTVYKAEQYRPVRRTVAIKVIKLGMDTRQVVARFEAERQALAMMDHPNIARVFDAGATETGRPYFVMELVAGAPITTYCDEHRLGVRDRLQLFARVCSAVQHAHQKAVIHRDLKPSNVLVTVVDGVAVPKVIDFGIAKAIDQRLTERTLFTEFHQLVGTPEYMSPEQADADGTDVDTRSDVYSLGVLLYELLTGVVPFDAKTLRRAAFAQIQQIIRETEPPRPSKRLSALEPAEAIEHAGRRSARPGELEKLLRGELEWITLKAMRKNRAERYRTASELAEDIENFLADRPLIAGPESGAYRARKFLRRNRPLVSAAAAVLLALLLGAIVSTWQAFRVREEQRRTLSEKLESDRLRGEAQQQRQLAQTNERIAQDRLAESLLVAADSLMQSQRVLDARQKYTAAWDVLRARGRSEFPAVSGLAITYDIAPPPVMVFGQDDGHHRVHLLHDGRTVLGSAGTDLVFWDLMTGRTLRRFGQLPGRAWDLSVDADESHALLGFFGPAVQYWDLRRQVLVREWVAHQGVKEAGVGVRIHPDGKHAVTGGTDGALRVWDLESGARVREIRAGPYGMSFYSIAISPDGAVIALAAGHDVELFDFASGAKTRSLAGAHAEEVHWASFSDDGRWLVSADGLGKVVEWDLTGTTAPRVLGAHAGSAHSVTYLPGEVRCVLSAADDYTVKLWPAFDAPPARRRARSSATATRCVRWPVYRTDDLRCHTAPAWVTGSCGTYKRPGTHSWRAPPSGP